MASWKFPRILGCNTPFLHWPHFPLLCQSADPVLGTPWPFENHRGFCKRRLDYNRTFLPDSCRRFLLQLTGVSVVIDGCLKFSEVLIRVANIAIGASFPNLVLQLFDNRGSLHVIVQGLFDFSETMRLPKARPSAARSPVSLLIERYFSRYSIALL